MSEEQTHTTEVREILEYGRLWSDGTFDAINWSDESMARRSFEEYSYRLSTVPAALRPVFAARKVVTTTQTYTPEEVTE